MLLLQEIRYFVHYYIMTLYRSASIILAISTPVVGAINGPSMHVASLWIAVIRLSVCRLSVTCLPLRQQWKNVQGLS